MWYKLGGAIYGSIVLIANFVEMIKNMINPGEKIKETVQTLII